MLNKLCIIAGERSGDLYGGRVINELKKMNPDTKVFGIGGDCLAAQGVELLYHIREMAFMGFWEVVKHLPFIKKVMNNLISEVKRQKPDAVLLIDYPGFNLKFAKEIRKHVKKIFYYISPQLWAWGKGRVEKVRKYIDKMIVIFSFEKDFYENYKINTDFVGHPLLEIISEFRYQDRESFFDKYGLDSKLKTLVVFPGSRTQEIKKHIKMIQDTIYKIEKKENLNIIMAGVSSVSKEFYYEIIKDKKIILIFDDQYNILKYSDFALVKSGTTTIETACFGVPMIIYYKTSALSYLIGRMLVDIRYFGMVNIIAEKEIVPELLQSEVNPDNLYKRFFELFRDNNKMDEIKIELKNVKNKLGELGASKRAAELIYNCS